MEQLTATVKQNADNAHHASKLAEDASGKPAAAARWSPAW
jgi:methyl-accepting chemotaxis protein-3 (ribose and galactose sensor receptor)